MKTFAVKGAAESGRIEGGGTEFDTTVQPTTFLDCWSDPSNWLKNEHQVGFALFHSVQLSVFVFLFPAASTMLGEWAQSLRSCFCAVCGVKWDNSRDFQPGGLESFTQHGASVPQWGCWWNCPAGAAGGTVTGRGNVRRTHYADKLMCVYAR